MQAVRSLHVEEARQMSRLETGAFQDCREDGGDRPGCNGHVDVEYDMFCNDRRVL